MYQPTDIRGTFFEPYTPVAGRVKSPSLNKELEYCNFYLSADANVTFVDYAGNAVSAYPLLKGRHNILVREISVVSAGIVSLVHDGVLSSTIKDR